MCPSKLDNTLTKKEPKSTRNGSKLLINNEISKKEGSEKKSECCREAEKCTTANSSLQDHSTNLPKIPLEIQSAQKGPKTRIVIKYDVGFKNIVTIRGKGAGLSWDRGLSLKNIKADEWIWETETPFTTGEFKVLINDVEYETGENHTLRCGASIQYTPKFY